MTVLDVKGFGRQRGQDGLDNSQDYDDEFHAKIKIELIIEDSMVIKALESIKNAGFKYIFLSYNNEGLLPPEQLREILERYGRYDLATTKYNRFKADKTENRNHKASSVVEYLHVLTK